MAADQSRIDELLERYLELVDEYSRLREDLSRLTRGVYHDIARANFSTDRGMRYGQDHYDDRMQATRRLDISVNGKIQVPSFSIVDFADPEPTEDPEGKTETANGDVAEDSAEELKSEADKTKKNISKTSKDPLRWFGVFSPPALRSAQGQSVDAIKTIIPRLATVNAEMLSLEIEVRRAKKKRTKTQSNKPSEVKSPAVTKAAAQTVS